MKVTLQQHGGFAAGMRQPQRTVDTAHLPEQAAKELTQLVAAAKAAPVVGDDPGRARDAMSYTISIEGDNQATELRQSDTSMSAAFAALLAWLRQQGAPR